MQYGAGISTYERKSKVSDDKIMEKQLQHIWILKNIGYSIIGVLISRVLLLNLDNTTAPFGIAFLIVMVLFKDEYTIAISGGCFLGYISIYNKISNLPGYLICIGSITAISYLLSRKSKKLLLTSTFSIVFIELLLSEFFIRSLSFKIAFLTVFLQMICIISLYFILERSLICIKEFKTKHLYSSEEVISVSILISLMLSGTWGISIYEISLRNILGLCFILIISYINGGSVGAASGIAIGTIIGVSSNNILIFVGVYGLCGLIAGIFKDSGKLVTAFTYVTSFIILKLYSNISIEFKLIEMCFAVLVFLSISNKIYEKLNLELDWEKKQEYLNGDYVDKIKEMLLKRLDNFSQILFNISDTLRNLSDNDKLVMKNKSLALVENLADRVCSGCNMNSTCWKRESYYTYIAFSELIQSHEEGKKEKMPHEIERKCIKRTLLLKSTEEIVNNYIINEMWRKRLSEGREVLAGQINNMGDSLKEVMEEFNSNVKLSSDTERNVRKILEKKNLKYKDVFCFRDKNEREVVKLSLEACGGSQLCVKTILPLINEATGRPMCISDEGCIIDPKTAICQVVFEETPKYYVASYASRQCKHGEKYNGDNYSFGKLGDGSYMSIISDGMGSGPRAGQESKAAVELVEKFTKAGLSKVTAINTVNSIMSLKFCEYEKFSTLDLNSVDLYTGEISFMKVGAVASFIKSGNQVQVINSKTLPFGVLDKVDVDVTNKKIKNGDIIIMLSDGVLDYDNQNTGKLDWLLEYLKESKISNPKELADNIITRAKELSGGKAKDDMTVIVSKVYSLY